MSNVSGVVLFMVDQLAACWLEAALDGAAPVPHLARLANAGTTFHNAFTNNPVCCPARATIATGLTAHQHGVLDCGYRLDPKVPTFMGALQNAGWRTAAFGKLHLLPQLESVDHDYSVYGFDVTAVSEDPRSGAWLEWVREAHPEHYRQALATVWMTMVRDLDAFGADRRNLRHEIEEARKAFEWRSAEFPDSDESCYVLPFPAEVSQTEWITARAVEFIGNLRPDDRFFAHISYVQPHNPFAAPEEFVRAINPSGLPTPLPAEWRHDPHAPAAFAHDGQVLDDRELRRWQQVRRVYFGDLSHLDAQLGRLFTTLEEAGRLASTAIVFLSDHGELLGDHGLYGKWDRHYDACIRVPLIVSAPGQSEGTTSEALVDLTDVAPTILDLAGLPTPTLPMHHRPAGAAENPQMLPGTSLLRHDDTRDAVYVESYNPYWSTDLKGWARTIRTRAARYTLYAGGGGEQLFDLADDPGEQRNLIGTTAGRELRQAMRDRLLELLIEQDYPPTPRGLFEVLAW